jgi:DNA replication protein DnaC
MEAIKQEPKLNKDFLSLLTEKTSISKSVEPIITELTEKEIEESLWLVIETVTEQELNEESKEQIKKLATSLTDKKKNFVILSGNCGTGKTTLMNAVVRLIEALRWNGNYNQSTGLKIVPRGAKKVFATEVNKNSFELLQDWQGVLMIDDFGIEPISNNDFGTIKTPMIDLIMHRYEERLPIIFSTNLSADDIKKRYGDRITDRFRERASLIKFTNKSYRI